MMRMKAKWGSIAVLAAAGSIGLASSSAAGSPTPPPPVFGQSVDAAPVSGQVFFVPPGGSRTPLTTAQQVPVGTILNVLHGTVKITAADGNGGTYSGKFGRGKFRVLQSASGDGTTEIKLTGKACSKSASVARSRRHRAYAYRQLQINANGNFLVVGADASAVASGQAKYSLVDACNGTQIVDQSGKVVAQRANAPSKQLDPGQKEIDYCRPDAQNPDFCLIVIESPRSGAYSFGLGLSQPPADSFKVCYVTPAGQKHCFKGSLSQGSIHFGALGCTINDGRGTYPFRYFVNGQPLGIKLKLKSTKPRQVFLGNDSCQNENLG